MDLAGRTATSRLELLAAAQAAGLVPPQALFSSLGEGIPNDRDPNPVVPNDPSEALPGPGENTGAEESTDSETANPGTSGGLLETNPTAAWILILIIALAGAIGAAPAIARARRKRREEKLELQ